MSNRGDFFDSKARYQEALRRYPDTQGEPPVISEGGEEG